jgi:hypothetical protein
MEPKVDPLSEPIPMLKFGHDYVDRGIEFYEAKYQHQQLQRTRKQAAALHMQLIPLTGVVS